MHPAGHGYQQFVVQSQAIDVLVSSCEKVSVLPLGVWYDLCWFESPIICWINLFSQIGRLIKPKAKAKAGAKGKAAPKRVALKDRSSGKRRKTETPEEPEEPLEEEEDDEVEEDEDEEEEKPKPKKTRKSKKDKDEDVKDKKDKSKKSKAKK